TAEFNGPAGMAADGAGDVFVAELFGGLRKISPAGIVTTLAGNGIAGYADGASSSAEFSEPQDIALDSQGNIYLSDYNNNVIRKISPAGWVSTYAGNGTPGLTNGATSSAQFAGPTGLAMDASGNLYVADRLNNAIREISASGVVSTLAGSGAAADAAGAGTSAEIDHPIEMAMDGAGNLYVGTLGRHVMKVSTSTGATTIFAGNGSDAAVDGSLASSSFNVPHVDFIDSSGNIWVGDSNVVRVITP
ncbi:MAG: hypothetical protein KGR26_09205, partial [Cyanobacteria bacterium REEB65]|nr:hypothetical protein [Cyanobacteria bacterium REEB65]